jgi:hypothetical protein
MSDGMEGGANMDAVYDFNASNNMDFKALTDKLLVYGTRNPCFYAHVSVQ